MSKKRIIAIVSIIVLLFAAGISVGVFLYGRGETEATDGSQVQATTDQNQVTDGIQQPTDVAPSGDDNENLITPEAGDENTETPDEENVGGAEDNEIIENEVVNNDEVADDIAEEVDEAEDADITTETDVNEVGETTITRVEEQERLISEGFWDWWQPMAVNITPTEVGVEIPQITVKKAAITGVGEDKFVYAGEDITYVISITNNGETAVENIEVTDKIPQQTTFVSAEEAVILSKVDDKITSEVVGSPTTVGTPDAIVGVNWIVTIPAGETVIARFTVNVNEEGIGTILNTAIANGEESNETKTSIIKANKSSIITRNNKEVEIAKIGDLITYKITVENTGEVEGTTYITDTVPVGTEFVSAQEGAKVTKSIDTGVIWSVTVPAGEKVTREFTVKVTSVDGEIKNVADVGGTPTNEDIVETADITVNKDITKITRKVDGVDTYLDLEDENLAVKEGDIIEYTILVTNTGSLDLTNVVLDEKLEGIILLNEEDLIIGDLPAGESVEITATYTVTYEADIKNKENREIYNEVYVSGETEPENPDEEPEKVEDNDDETVEVEEAPSWKVEKVADKTSEVKAGEIIHYTITVTNTGNVKLANIPVSDIITIKDAEGNAIETIPDVKLYEEYKIDENNKDVYSKEITTIPELVVEGSKTLYASYTVKQTDVDNNVKITNIAYANEQPSEEVITTPEEPVPGMLVEKEAKQVKRDGKFIAIKDAGKVRTGEVVKYEIKVTNTGNTTLTNVVITDTLDVRVNDENAEITTAGTLIKVADEMLPNSNPITITTYYIVDESDMENEKINNIAIGTAETPVTPTTPEGTITDNDDEEIVVNPNTSIAVIKIWDDADNQDGKRPDSVTVQLKAGEENYGEAIVLNDNNEWKKEWNTLPKYNGENVISYTVVETKVGNEDVVENKTTYYTTTQTTEGNTVTITNTHTPEKVKVEGSKTWDDADNQDGKRPESITIRLLADGEEVNTATVTSENDWSWSFENLPVYKAGKEIVYTITEDAVAEYETTISGYNVTNKHTPETVKVEGSKTWDDANNQDGKRPSSITIRLLADGTEVDSATVTATENWAWSFADLPKYEAGKEIVYTIAEDTVAEYETTISGYNVTNKHTPETVKVEGSKTWDDADNQDGKRPTSITIRLLADGTEVKTATVTATENWAWSFADLPKYEDGKEIVYTITEDIVTGYETIISGYNVTNKHTPETVKVEGSKTWNDANNQDGKRPESITIRVLADGTEVKTATVTASDYWSWSFANLPKYKEGKEIVYTITEDAVSSYETTVSGYNVTNTHTPETVKVEGSKTWDDANNQDGKRPESITINLLADGEEVKTATVTATENWAWSFADLPKYKDGKEIVYTITEDAVSGYEIIITGYNVTNKHTPETVKVEGSKTWDDADNQDGKRPTSITIRLLADGTEVKTATVTAAENWAWSFADLPKYKDGKEIVYTITEDAVSGYETTVSGYDVTNKYAPETVKVEGSKTWDDANNQDGKRPESITIYLLADGEEVNSATVTAAENWAWSFTDLPKYKEGKEIVYTITEDTVTGYETTISGYNVTNKHTPETVKVEGSKTWNDANNQDGKRPTSITIRLLADGTEVKSATVTATENWSWSFADLPKYKDGKEIDYTITEDAVTGYETTVTGYDVTNKYTPETISIPVTKTWDDKNNQEGARTAVTIQLLAGGKAVEGKTLTLSEENGWTATFTDLPKYESGAEISYTVSETTVLNGYETPVITGNAQSGFTVTNKMIITDVDFDKKATTITTNNGGVEETAQVIRDEYGNVTTYVTKIGDVITYTITVTNNSNVVLKEVNITDETHTVNVVKVQKGENTVFEGNTQIAATNNLLSVLPDTMENRYVLGINETYEITVEYVVDNITNIENIQNTAKISGKADEIDDPITEEDTETVPVVQIREGAITKTSVKVDKNTIDTEKERNEILLKANQTVSYEIVVENKGNVTLTEVAVTDVIENAGVVDTNGVRFISITNANGERQTNLESASNSSNLLGKTTLEPGEKYIITVTYTVDGIINEDDLANGDKLINTAYLKYATPEGDKTLDDKDILNKYKASNISRTKTSQVIRNGEVTTDNRVNAGDIIEYTITVENSGNISTETTVTDSLLKQNITDNKVVMMLNGEALTKDASYTAKTITVESTNTNNNTTTTVNDLADGLQLTVDNGEKYKITFSVKVGSLLPGQEIVNKLDEQEDINIQNDVEASITVYKKLVQPQNAVIVIDCSLSMAEAVDYSGNADPMADSYYDTRWYALTEALNKFLETYMDGKNKVTIIGYNNTAFSTPLVSNCTVLQTALDSYKNILTETQFNFVLSEQIRKGDTNDVDNLTRYGTACRLGSGTNVDDGLRAARDYLGSNNTKGAQVILMTDGEANRKGTVGNESIEMTEAMDAAATKATTLKNRGATLYTVSLSLGSGNQTYITRLENMASVDENGNKLSKTTSTMDELIKYFKEISEAISEQTIITKTIDGILYLSEEFNLNTNYVKNVEIVIPNNDGVGKITLTWADFAEYYNPSEKTIDVTTLAEDKGITGITGDVSITINVDTTI